MTIYSGYSWDFIVIQWDINGIYSGYDIVDIIGYKQLLPMVITIYRI